MSSKRFEGITILLILVLIVVRFKVIFMPLGSVSRLLLFRFS